MITKSRVVEALVAQLELSCKRMLEAARKTEEAATDSESRAEGKYDTRGLEASYLAAGQAAQVEELTDALRKLRLAPFPDFAPNDPVDAGALVEARVAGEFCYFLLAPAAGGTVVEIEGSEVTVLAPGAPLRGKMTGLGPGERLPQPELEVVAVR